MTLYLVRHAQAGSRSDWRGDDRTRPLTSSGRHQAADLVGTFAEMGIEKIMTSPFVLVTEALAEGPHEQALQLARNLADEDVMFCSHGDIIPALLDTFAYLDGLDLGRTPKCQKGSVWALEPAADFASFVRAQYIAPD
jgi:8-oxo-(d)GTP phosphatase